MQNVAEMRIQINVSDAYNWSNFVKESGVMYEADAIASRSVIDMVGLIGEIGRYNVMRRPDKKKGQKEGFQIQNYDENG